MEMHLKIEEVKVYKFKWMASHLREWKSNTASDTLMDNS